MYTVNFKFKPYQYVTITGYGLNHPGRVISCTVNVNVITYHVEYAHDGSIDTMHVTEDQLKESNQ